MARKKEWGEMASGKDVRPGNWSEVKDLYDDGEMSLIWGRYDGAKAFDIGIRWNGSGADDPGYPKCFGNPVWFVLPPMFAIPVLHALQEQVLVKPCLGDGREINKALGCFCNRVIPVHVQQIIGIFGAANMGKTSMLKELVRLMIVEGWKVVSADREDWEQDGMDAIVVLDGPGSGRRVAVNTGGDLGNVVQAGWEICCKWRADIGVMASRKRDDSSSVQAVYAASRESGAPITWVAKRARVASPSDACDLWRQEARSLLDMINAM